MFKWLKRVLCTHHCRTDWRPTGEFAKRASAMSGSYTAAEMVQECRHCHQRFTRWPEVPQNEEIEQAIEELGDKGIFLNVPLGWRIVDSARVDLYCGALESGVR